MSDIDTLIKKSGMLLRDYKYTEVIDLCSKVLEIDSTNEFALMYMGKAYRHLKNYNESAL